MNEGLVASSWNYSFLPQKWQIRRIPPRCWDTFWPGCNKAVTIVMAQAHKLSFVELQTFEELGISVHKSVWLLFQGHGLWPRTGSTHSPRESSPIFQRNWLSGKRYPGHNSGFISGHVNPSIQRKIWDKVKDTSDCSSLLLTQIYKPKDTCKEEWR